MGWKNWELDMTLLLYRDKWYRTTDDMKQGRMILQVFDVVIEVAGNRFNVIKNRYTGECGEHVVSDLLRMQLFAAGLTFDDLPEFTKAPYSQSTSVIGYKDNGDLFEYPEPTRTM